VIRSREVIPTSLEHALIANRVLVALASGDLTSQESQDAMEDGLRFLKSVLKGEELTASRSVEADSYKAALAYGEGVKAFELVEYKPGQNENPTTYLQALLKYASTIREQPRTEEAVQKLTGFFQIIRDLALEATERPIETVNW
jgi:hypothetical protein